MSGKSEGNKQSLIEAAELLAAGNVPDHGWDDNGEPTNHWSATLDTMVEHLGRKLTEAEVTLLSLSRAWGPMPAIDMAERQEVLEAIWPHGNSCGLRMSWEDLRDALSMPSASTTE